MGIQSNDIFTNRVAELAQLERSRGQLRSSPATADPGNLDLPRHNVINFFGMGGIGKSTLSRRIERNLRHQAGDSLATMRIDLEEASSFDLESVILRLRAAAGFLGRPLVAFDVGLAHYWQRMHPGEELGTFIARNNRLRRAAEKVGLSEHVAEAVKEVAGSLGSSSTVAAIGVKSLQVIVGAIRSGRELRHAVDGCRYLAPMLEADVGTDYLSYLPALLAWDLSQGDPAELVVFVDTYEKLDRRQVSVEGLLQRMVFLLPGALFVISGRDRLTWADVRRAGELDYVGERFWPGLVPHHREASRCVLVGNLSAEDARRYLMERVTVGVQAAIPSAIRENILEAAHGLPLYLDLAVNRYVAAVGAGAPLRPEDFGDAFPSLVARVMSDLQPEQRAVLRGVSLIGAFDRDLARAAGGQVSDGAVASLVARSFVMTDADRVLPYTLHPTLRETLITGSAIESDAWSELDWLEAAHRLYDELGRRLHAESSREMLLEICLRGLILCDQFDLDPEWIGDAAEALYGLGLPVGIESSSSFRPDSPASQIAKVIEVVRARGRSPCAESVRELQTVLERRTLPPRTAAWAEVIRSDCLMDLGDYRAAERGYRRVLDGLRSLRTSNNALVSLRMLLTKAGRFQEALDLRGEVRFDNLRIEADVRMRNADWEEAEKLWSDALADSVERDHAGLESLCRTSLAIIDGWRRIGDGAQARSAVHVAVITRGGWSHPAALAAEALALTGRDSQGAAEARRRSRSAASQLDLHDNVFDVLMAEAFDAAVAGDMAWLSDVRTALEAEVERDGAHVHWLHVVSWWLGLEANDSDAQVQWLDGPAAARERWMHTVAVRRSEVDA